MSVEDERRAPTVRFHPDELAKLAELTKAEIISIPLDQLEDPFGGWDEPTLADGTPSVSTSLASRTQTVADPLTTEVLAEVSRRATTVDEDDADNDVVIWDPIDPPKPAKR